MLMHVPIVCNLQQKGTFFMTNYTDEQKSRIMQMPAAVLLESMQVDAGSAVVGMREFVAGEKFITDVSAQFPRNALIQSIAREANLPKLEEIVQHLFTHGDSQTMHADSQKKISAGLAVLAHDEEANQFKAFLVALAERVVEAAGEGFFGNRGAKVSPHEAAYIQQLKRQLSVASAPSM